ncbi:hypothetical protein JJD41_20590 [Oxynema sp. CENA135]|nr:hypothetical protein [Oxynema sp. CENA135]
MTYSFLRGLSASIVWICSCLDLQKVAISFFTGAIAIFEQWYDRRRGPTERKPDIIEAVKV